MEFGEQGQRRLPHWISLVFCGWLWSTLAGGAVGQPPPPPGGPPLPGMQDPLDLFGPAGRPDGLAPKAEFSGEFGLEQGTRRGKLTIHATIQPNWHIYSMTQPSGGPMRTEIAVDPGPDFEVRGSFQADRDPLVHEDPAFPGAPVEEYAGQVSFTVGIELAPSADPANLTIRSIVNGQACETGGSCVLLENIEVLASFAGFYEPVAATGSYHYPRTHATLTGTVEPKVVAPGGQVTIKVTASMPNPWHIYAHEDVDEGKSYKPTLVVLRKSYGWPVGEIAASSVPHEVGDGSPSDPVLKLHERAVTWSFPVTVPPSIEPGSYELVGAIGYQTCTDEVCDQPAGARFTARFVVGSSVQPGAERLAFADDKYDDIATVARERLETRKTLAAVSRGRDGPLAGRSMLFVLGIAYLAGLILNVMPCVLPVIGLKVMSFVQQAGGSRREILALNLWFSLGLLSVFWVLAGMAAFANMGWAEHFGNTPFTITMIGIVFAFALSFLGIWEIPIPGFVGSGKMGEAAEREGVAGAYTKGVLSTILATPCAGPLLVPAVSWAMKQPAGVTFVAFTAIGLGMATPYLLIGAFPRLIGLLPKPGPWMETFKQVMGFLLLATVIFLFRSVETKWLTSTLTLLLGISVGCWWIGRTPLTVGPGKRALAWANSLLVIAASVWLGFIVLVPYEGWVPYTRVALDQHLAKGHTVMIDFTANW